MQMFRDPVIYGPYYNDTMHLIPFYMKEHLKFDVDKLNMWIRWVQDISQYMPCSTCAFHYVTYITETAPPDEMKTYDEAWKWSVDRHNAINERTKTPVLSYREAEKALRERTLLNLIPNHTLTNWFSMDVWIMLAIATYTNFSAENDKESFIAFMKHTFQLIPFGYRKVQGQPVSDMLIKYIDQDGKFDSMDEAFDTLRNLYNHVAPHFNTKELSDQEWENRIKRITEVHHYAKVMHRFKQKVALNKKLVDQQWVSMFKMLSNVLKVLILK